MTMGFRHVVSHLYRRARRRYSFLRYLSPTTATLIVLWYFTLYWGERAVFASHIAACHWDTWERWGQDAAPRHMVLVADPQLVDPHTYPGRPWPLSKLTEIYTDMYMATNFRLINAKLDPDEIVFLGDLFDGGREWATNRAKPFQREPPKEKAKKNIQADRRRSEQAEKLKTLIENAEEKSGKKGKRSEESYLYALEKPHSDPISKADHNLAKDGKTDLRGFQYGENGRWAKWDTSQWDSEFQRFGNIFFAPEQLYPRAGRDFVPVSSVDQHPTAIENGAKHSVWQEYAVNGRQRQLWTSLPGNHDLGFGNQVQWSVRDRFETYFGETNGLRVIGNHTFVAVDSPSYSAYHQWLLEGGDTTEEGREAIRHIWEPTHEFLLHLNSTVPKAVAETLHTYYPAQERRSTAFHDVIETSDSNAVTPVTYSSQVPIEGQVHLPVVLLTHIPLFRNPEVDCGRHREKGHAISISAGYQYQNVLTPALTSKIVQQVATAGQIAFAFSGDDHDYCDVTHNFNFRHGSEPLGKDSFVIRSFPEVTVKSFSWAMGVRLPGFLLVSLWNPIDELGQSIGTSTSTVQTHLCILPDQLITFIAYGKLLGFTMFVLLIRAMVLGARHKPERDRDSSEDEDDSRYGFTLPRFRPKYDEQNSAPSNGGMRRKQGETSKHRHRTSSISTSAANTATNTNLSVQRNYYARTRSVSPAAGFASMNTYNMPAALVSGQPGHPPGPLIDNAGYYPQSRWVNPDESDEESHLGDDDHHHHHDSQAKWKKRKVIRNRPMKAVIEFFAGMAVVAIPCALYYGVLIKNG